MTYLDFSHIELKPEFIEHVLHGEKGEGGKGGHLAGTGRENKTEFPEDWNEENIEQALASVLKKPDSVVITGSNIYLRRVVVGVNIQFVLISLKRGLTPFAAYPIGGPGVIQNIMGNRHPLPINNYRNEL